MLMITRTIALLLLIAACMPFVAAGQTNESSPARVVSKNILLYAEADNLLELLAGIPGQTGQQETVLDVALDLSPSERTLLAQSRLAVVVWNKSANGKGTARDLPVNFISILQTPDANLTTKLSNLIKETLQTFIGTTGPAIQFSAITTGSPGNAIAFGPADSVESFLTDLRNRTGETLENSADFQRLRRRSEHANIFVYANGPEVMAMANAMVGQGADRANYELAMKFLGLYAMRAGALNFSTLANSPGRLSVIVDSKQSGFLPMLAGVPLSNFPSARLAPADSQIFFTLKIDPARLYETVIQTFFAGDPQADPLSSMAGPNARHDLIDNLTGEIAVSASITNLAEMIAKNTGPQFKFIGLVEVKNRATFQPVFARLISSNPNNSSEPILNRNGIEVFGNKDRAWAYVDNYLVLGSSDDVTQAIDMTRGTGTLAATPAFQATLKRFEPSGIGLLFVNLAPLLRSSPGAAKLLAGTFLGSLPAQLAVFAGRKDEEIYLESSLTGPGGSAAFVIAASAAMAIPNLLSARKAANGASAVEAIRLFHSVEVTYQAGFGKGRFGTAAELFKEDFIDPALADASGVPSMTSTGGQVCPGTGQPKSGYTFKLQVTAKGRKFQAVAIPASTNSIERTGDRSFFVDETGVIRVTSEPRPAQADDPPLN